MGGDRALPVREVEIKVEQYPEVSLGRKGWRKTRLEGRTGGEERVGQVGSAFCLSVQVCNRVLASLADR